MKDTGKRLCLPYLWVEQPKPQSGQQLGHAPRTKLPLALTLGGEGGRQERVAAGVFLQNQPPQNWLLSPIPDYLPEGSGWAWDV